MMHVITRILVLCGAAAGLCSLIGCGLPAPPLETFNVTLEPTQDCTLTGSTSRDCADPATLEQQHKKGRWVFEHMSDDSFALTTDVGITLPGIYFEDDGQVLTRAPCLGNGGRCYFARRAFESTDDDNNGCTRFGELMAILSRVDESSVTGILADTQGVDEDCGTSTVLQRTDAITGTLAAEPALARQEAP